MIFQTGGEALGHRGSVLKAVGGKGTWAEFYPLLFPCQIDEESGEGKVEALIQNVCVACRAEVRICRLLHGPSCSEGSVVMLLTCSTYCSSSYIPGISSSCLPSPSRVSLFSLGQSKNIDKAIFG